MARFDFKSIIIVLALSYGFLFAFSALGILQLFLNLIPGLGQVDLGPVTAYPVAALISIIVLSILATLVAFAINQAIDQPKTWAIIIVMAIVSAAIWIFAPTLLPKELQLVAGTAQSMFTGSLPQALMIP